MSRLYKAIRPASGYHTDQPPNTSRHTAEPFAEVRDNGRILDNTRFVLGGTDILEAEILVYYSISGKHYSAVCHRRRVPTPPPSLTAGKNYMNEEITPPPLPHWDRRAI